MFVYLLFIAFTLLIINLILIYLKRKKKFQSLMAAYAFTGMTSLPVLGIAHYFIGSNERRMKSLQLIGRVAVNCGGAIAGWFGHIPFLVVSDAELGDMLTKICLDKDDIMKILKCVVGEGVIIAPMHSWRRRRRIIVPTFATKNLRKFVGVFNKQANLMMNQLMNNIGGTTFSIWRYLACNNMDSVCENVFGIEMHSQTDPTHPFMNSFEKVASMLASRLSQPWLHSDLVFNHLPRYKTFEKELGTLYNFVDGVIEAKRKELEDIHYVSNKNCTQKKKIRTFLDLIIESSNKESELGEDAYNNRQLREETMTLVIAGTDTSAAALAFTVLCLSNYQDVQEKVYEEILDVFGDSERPVEPEDLKKLTYMEAVISEVIRLYPSVPVFLRRVSEDITLQSGVLLPEGCNIMMNAWALHRNPKYWGNDAEEFRPERFLKPLKHPAQFMGFGHGPRNCVGYRYAMLSMKTVLSTLLRQCRLLPNKEGDFAPRLSFEIFLKDLDNFQVRLETRKQKF